MPKHCRVHYTLKPGQVPQWRGYNHQKSSQVLRRSKFRSHRRQVRFPEVRSGPKRSGQARSSISRVRSLRGQVWSHRGQVWIPRGKVHRSQVSSYGSSGMVPQRSGLVPQKSGPVLQRSGLVHQKRGQIFAEVSSRSRIGLDFRSSLYFPVI